MAIVSVVVLVSIWTPSSNPDIFIFSFTRLAGIIVGAAAFLYFAASIFSRALMKANNILVYFIVTTVLLHEIVIRSFPFVLNDAAISLLPLKAYRELAQKREGNTSDMIEGKGLLYHWKPLQPSLTNPKITADENGYRNDRAPGQQIDVVVMGGSVTLAMSVEQDWATLFRNAGVSAYSLAMGSYSIFHHRDAYRKYIIEKGIAHSNVIVTLTLPNALNKAISYTHAKKAGKNWPTYLEPRQTIPMDGMGDYLPWTIAILNKVPFLLVQEFRTIRRNAAFPSVDINIDYADYAMHGSGLILTEVPSGWPLLEKGMKDLAAMVRKNGAKILFVFYPSISVRNLPYFDGYEEQKAAIKKNYRDTVSRLEKIAASQGAGFFDLTPSVQKAFGRELINTTPYDYHLNQRGVEITFEKIRSVVGF